MKFIGRKQESSERRKDKDSTDAGQQTITGNTEVYKNKRRRKKR